MHIFRLHPVTAAILISLLVMGVFGCFVWLPVVLINWVWNVCLAGNTSLPPICLWQAALLYLALACIIYLSDLVHIEIKAETSD